MGDIFTHVGNPGGIMNDFFIRIGKMHPQRISGVGGYTLTGRNSYLQ